MQESISNTQKLLKTWNDKHEFNDLMNGLNKQVLEQDFFEKATQFKSQLSSNSKFNNMNSEWIYGNSKSNFFRPDQTSRENSPYPYQSVYEKFRKEKEVLEEEIERSKMKTGRKNFNNVLSNDNDLMKINFDLNTPSRLDNNINPMFQNNDYSKTNLESNLIPNLEFTSENNTNKARISRSKEKRVQNFAKSDLENTSIISSIHFDRSASKKAKKKDDNKKDISDNKLIELHSQDTSRVYENHPNYFSNRTYYEKVNQYLATNKNSNSPIKPSVVNKLNVTNGMNNENKTQYLSFRPDNSMDPWETNKFDKSKVNMSLIQNSLVTNRHQLEKARTNKFSKRLEFESYLEKKPNSSLFKKYTDVNANSSYYFPSSITENDHFDTLKMTSNELQWKERTNRNFFYQNLK